MRKELRQYDLEQRLIDFAEPIVRTAKSLPKSKFSKFRFFSQA